MAPIWDFRYYYLKGKERLKSSFSVTCRIADAIQPTQSSPQSTGHDVFIDIVLEVICFVILSSWALPLFPFLFLVGLLGTFVKLFTSSG